MFAPIGTGPDGWGISIYNMHVYGNPLPPPPNLALGGEAQAGRYTAQSIGSENNARQPWRAFDGDNSSRWAAHIAGAPAQPNTWTWLAVDLLDSYLVERVEILWEASFAREFEIWVSNLENPRTSPPATGNGTFGATSTTPPGEGTWADDWTVVARIVKTDSAPDTITLDPIAARHVMMFSPRVTGSAGWPISIFEMGVFGRPGEREPADYSAVDAAIEAAQAVDRTLFTEESLLVLDNAVAAVVRGLLITDQEIVDGFAAAINAAIDALVRLPVEFAGTNPSNLMNLLQTGNVVLQVQGNLGIFPQHSPFVVPAGRTLYIETTLNVQRDAELIIEGTVVVLPTGRINNQANNTSGGTITIAESGRLVNDGYIENVSGSRVFNNGTIINNARFEVRARTMFINSGTVGGTRPLNIHRDAILVDNRLYMS